MTRTGPQKIPGASQQYFFGTGRYSGSDMEVNCGVVHTTEGMSLTTYSSGAMAPNVTGVPDIKARKIRWFQHFDVDESARALENRSGGVETNTANAFQMELVGTCDANHAKTWNGKKAGVDYIYWPEAPDWALAEVAVQVRWLHDQHNIPLTCVKDWLAYGTDSRRPGVTPASYGASPARMSMTQWRSFTGWCGHQHVPENVHGDPGSMDFPRVIALAKGSTNTPSEEDDMTPEQAKKLDELHALLTPFGGWDYKGKGKTADAYSHLTGTDARTVEILAAIKQLGSAGLSAAQIQAAAEAGANAALKALADRLTP
ncbi:N-acetylmuramoyl-L-alanine amidase [Streptomyces sp. NPDC087866]|uniref:N-acetylmuramoyl-L-alanine amidase n=1 Tax=Streptomyces sp. NPDC087866 TaxID=3365815 RepID=UPI003807E760